MTNNVATMNKLISYVIESPDPDRVLATNLWADVESRLAQSPLRPDERVIRMTTEVIAEADAHGLSVKPVDDDERVYVLVDVDRGRDDVVVEASMATACGCGWSSNDFTVTLVRDCGIEDFDGEIPESFSVECPDCGASAVLVGPFEVEGLDDWESALEVSRMPDVPEFLVYDSVKGYVPRFGSGR